MKTCPGHAFISYYMQNNKENESLEKSDIYLDLM